MTMQAETPTPTPIRRRPAMMRGGTARATNGTRAARPRSDNRPLLVKVRLWLEVDRGRWDKEHDGHASARDVRDAVMVAVGTAIEGAFTDSKAVKVVGWE